MTAAYVARRVLLIVAITVTLWAWTHYFTDPSVSSSPTQETAPCSVVCSSSSSLP